MNEDKLVELVEIQRDMLRWIRFNSIPQLKRTLEAVLVTDLDKRAYEMTDGGATTRAIASALSIGKTTVVSKWGKWAQIGIVERLASGQCRRICSLADVGIEVPQTAGAPEESAMKPEEEAK